MKICDCCHLGEITTEASYWVKIAFEVVSSTQDVRALEALSLESSASDYDLCHDCAVALRRLVTAVADLDRDGLRETLRKAETS